MVRCLLFVFCSASVLAASEPGNQQNWAHHRQLELRRVRRLFHQGKHKQAIAHAKHCLARDQKHFPKRPETSESLNELAYVHEALGDYKQAASKRQALTLLRQLNQWPHAVLENELHLQRLKKISRFDKAKVNSLERLRALRLKLELLMLQGEFRKAMVVRQAATRQASKLFGQQSPLSCDMLMLLAEAQGRSDQLSAANKNLEACLKLRSKLFGNDHPQVAATMTLLAWTNVISGKPQKGLELFRSALAICERVFPMGHVQNLEVRQGISEITMMRGDLAGCRYHLDRSLKEIRYLFGASKTNFEIDVHSRLGALQLFVGDVDLAITHFERAQAMAKSLGRYDTYNQAIDNSNLAKAYSLIGQHAKAVNFAAAAVRNFKETIGAGAIHTARTMVMQGDVLLAAGRHALATKTHERALRIYRAQVDGSAGKLAGPLLSLSRSRSANKQHKRATELAREALSIAKRAYGELHVELIRCHLTLADVLTAAGQLVVAERHYHKAMKLTELAVPEVMSQLSETESLRFVKRVTESRDKLIGHWQKMGKKPRLAAYRLLWKTRGMVTRAVAERSRQVDAKSNTLLAQLLQTRRQLARAYRYRKVEPASLERLTKKKERLEQRLATTKALPKSFSLSTLARVLWPQTDRDSPNRNKQHFVRQEHRSL